MHKGKRNREEGGNYKEISLLLYLGKTFPGILAGRLRDWLFVRRIRSIFQTEFGKGKEAQIGFL
jgi:hypothetical protein